MSAIQWTNRYSVGVTQLDEQHQKILELINSLAQCMVSDQCQQAVPHVLNEMHSYILEHFGLEERLLLKVRYPRFNEQRDSHNGFIKQFSNFCAEVDGGGKETIQSLLDFLTNWWDSHILREDMGYKGLL